jgi:UDP-N-acetylmuramoyl-tripeptide--D-alanyl-D-alanine ligase
MRELGGASAQWHMEILRSLPAFSNVILLGEEWFDPTVEMPVNAQRYRTFEEITNLTRTVSFPDSVILVKGSNSYGLKRLVALLTEG